MRTTNPAIRSLLTSTGTVPTGRSGEPTARRRAAHLDRGTGRAMLIDDVVTRTATTLGASVASAIVTAYLGLWAAVLPAGLFALGLGLYLTFRPRPSAALALSYALAQGVVVGATTSLLDGDQFGIVTQAVTGTGAVFVAMLLVYKVRLLRLTTKWRKYFFLVGVAVLALTLINAFAAGVLGIDLGLRGGSGVLSVVLSLICICLAAVSLLLSFEAVDNMIRQGVSVNWAWYLAFGLVMTLLWLYLEMFWLLAAGPR